MRVLFLKVLGALEFMADDQPIPTHFRSDKVRALLVYLALEAGRPHQRRSLAALLWPDFPEQDSLRNLRKTLFHLRESLDQVAPQASQSLLTVDRQTVQFNSHNVTVDAIQFEQWLAEVEGHGHRHLHHCPDCLARLVKAESLFRGELLPGFNLVDALDFEEWLLFKREQLQQEAILMLQNLAIIYEQQKDYERTEKVATRLTLLDPYYEKAVRQLMRVFSHTDRRSAALQLYNRLADRLQAEIGVEPEAKTSQLFQRISGGMALEPVQAVRRLHHFPAQFTPFLGRKEELVQVSEFLLDADCRLLTIMGAGGMGKTRLAIEVAQQIAEGACFADGLYFVHLGAVESGDDLLTALATALALLPRANAPLLAQILDFLKAKQCLLVLDNFEQLVGEAVLLNDILANAPEVQLLVTSRFALNVRVERRVLLLGLALPQADASEQDIAANGSVGLFVESARRVSPDFRLTGENQTAVIQICQLVGGLPLALEIAGAWTRLMSEAEIAAEIRQDSYFLTTPMRDLPGRHRSMNRVFDYSWRLLAPFEQLLLAKASIFREPFGLATAVAVLGATMNDIAVLLDKSLLQSPASGRFGLHELLRQYLLGKLREMDNGAEIEACVRQKHSHYYLKLVGRIAADFYGSEPHMAATTIRQRLGNITQAWWWVVAHVEEPEQQLMIADSLDGLGRFYDFGGLTGDGERMIGGAVVKVESLLRGKKGGETAVVTLLSHLLAWQAHFKNRLGEAEIAIQTARKSLAHGEGEPQAAARAKSLLGELLPNIGQFDEAEHYQQGALSYYREVGDKVGQAQALGRLGIMRWRRGSYRQAVPPLKEALVMQELLDNKGAMATLSGSIAGLYYEQGDIKLAQAYVEQARNFFTETENVLGVAQTDGYLALLYLKLGQYELALTHNQRQLDVYRDSGDRQTVAMTIGNRGAVFMEVGKFDEALACYQEAQKLTGSLGLSWHSAMHQSGVASVWQEKGDNEQAVALYEQAIPVLREHGAKFYAVSPLLGLARIFLEYGRLPEAQILLYEARDLAKQLKLQKYILEVYTLIARLDFIQGDTELARGQMFDLLASCDDPIEQANFHYELWRMGAGDEHARTAYERYCQQYEEVPKYVFRRRLDELRIHPSFSLAPPLPLQTG